MAGKKGKKKWALVLVLVLAVVCGGAGIFYAAQGSGEPVNVFPFMYVGMTEYWGDNQESYGPVTTDNIQTVFLSDTQTITEIKVALGDTVKKGDLLMTFDTTLDTLKVERKGIEVEKLKLEWKDAIHELENVKNMDPMYIPENYPEEETKEPFRGVELKKQDEKLIYSGVQGEKDGSTKEKAFIWWMHSDHGEIDRAKLKAFWEKARELQPPPEETQPEIPDEPEDLDPTKVIVYDPMDGIKSADEPEENPDEDEKEEEEPKPFVFYMILKETEDNWSNSAKTLWQGLKITVEEKENPAQNVYSVRFFDASGATDFTMVKEEEPESAEPDFDFGSGYTKQQLAEMRKELEKRIKELEFNIRMAEAEYKLMQLEISDGNIYADFNGEVVSLLTEEEARNQRQPLIKVSGGGGFFVEGSVSELEKDKLRIGQEVTVNDWNTGSTYTGEVRQIGDFPASGENWNGMGNPNASYYPFRVFIDGEANLQSGSYVSVMYSTSGAENGIYLENPFIREEQGQSYVLVMGSNGKIEKRIVTVGKSLWGSYQEILSGITEADLIAFPYGKHVKVGAPAVESDISTLYGY